MSRKWMAFVASVLVLNATLWLAGGVFARGIDQVSNYFFGPNMVRAEVVMKLPDGLHDFRIDRGVIVAVAPGSLTLREKDDSVVTMSLAPNVEVTLGGQPRQLRALKPRMVVQAAVRDGSGPVTRIVATKR